MSGVVLLCRGLSWAATLHPALATYFDSRNRFLLSTVLAVVLRNGGAGSGCPAYERPLALRLAKCSAQRDGALEATSPGLRPRRRKKQQQQQQQQQQRSQSRAGQPRRVPPQQHQKGSVEQGKGEAKGGWLFFACRLACACTSLPLCSLSIRGSHNTRFSLCASPLTSHMPITYHARFFQGPQFPPDESAIYPLLCVSALVSGDCAMCDAKAAAYMKRERTATPIINGPSSAVSSLVASVSQ